MKYALRDENEMKGSGVEWIGAIPEKWNSLRLNSLFQQNKKKNDRLVEDNLLSLSYGKIIRKDIDANEGLLPASFSTYQIVQPGFIILRLTDLQNDKKSLRVGHVREKGIITAAYLGLDIIALDQHEDRYFYYLLHTYDLMKVFYNFGAGVRQSLNFNEFKKMDVVAPPKDEQKRIADFLDEKTIVIDEVVKKKKKQIELLKEKRAALITQAVTKGLDSNVKMKDSGVEWIGEIPEHWNVKRQKDFIANHFGGTWGDGEATQDDGVLCVRVADFVYRNLTLKKEGYTFRDIAKNHLAAKKLHEGDLLLEKSGGGEKTPVGRIVQFTLNVTAVNSNFIETLRLDKKVDSSYFTYLNRGMYVLGVNKKYIKQTTGIQNLDIKAYLSESIPVPEVNEQKRITEFLDKKSQEIDRAIRKIQKSINLIQEYRSSLISHVVTGKIVIQ